MTGKPCWICLEPISGAQAGDVHRACARDLYAADSPPALPFGVPDLRQIAEHLVRSHVTVPGVQPKLSLHLEQAAGGRLTLVDMEGEFIFKPPSPVYPELPELEHTTLRMAAAAGLAVCRSGLIRLPGGERGLIVRRMDRESGRKLAMEDLCQLSDRLTEDKYRGSLEKAGKIIRQHSHAPGMDAVSFVEVVLFCFLTGNADMHWKNFSLLTDSKGRIRLAPAYDLVPTALVLPEDREESALTLNGKKSRLRWDDFLALGEALHLTARQVMNARERLLGALPGLQAVLDRSPLTSETQARFRTLLENRRVRLEV